MPTRFVVRMRPTTRAAAGCVAALAALCASVAVVFPGAARASANYDLRGTWDTSGYYQGAFVITWMDRATGAFSGEGAGGSFPVLTGTVSGTSVTFTQRFGGFVVSTTAKISGTTPHLKMAGKWTVGGGHSGAFSATAGALVASGTLIAPVGLNPQESVLDPATHTLYVADSHADDGQAPGIDDNVSVLDASTCNARVSSGCNRIPPTVPAGDNPGGIGLDLATDTIYVADGNDGKVSVINGATCNAENTSGCHRAPPTVTVGTTPVDLRVDQATNTVYVANWGNGTGTTVSVIDGKTCNGLDSAGCAKAPASVTIGRGPAGLAVDPVSDTVYAGTVGAGGAEAVWVIDGATCNATTSSGCAQHPPSVKVGQGSTSWNVGLAIDSGNHTLYVENFTSDTVSMIDAATCNAVVATGCNRAPKVALAGTGPDAIAVDASTHTVYVANTPVDTLSLLDASSCNATTTTGCRALHSDTMGTGQTPQSVTLDPATATAYVPNGDNNDVSILNLATCNATRHSGCAHP